VLILDDESCRCILIGVCEAGDPDASPFLNDAAPMALTKPLPLTMSLSSQYAFTRYIPLSSIHVVFSVEPLRCFDRYTLFGDMESSVFQATILRVSTNGG
jgi:hypothetical protein